MLLGTTQGQHAAIIVFDALFYLKPITVTNFQANPQSCVPILADSRRLFLPTSNHRPQRAIMVDSRAR